MQYKNIIIYYMSGTGNSYRISTIIGEIAEKNKLNTSIISAHNAKSAEETKNGNHSLMGIVFPTHGFTMPWNILKFAFHLRRGKSNHAFCIATRGSLKFGSVFIPGLSGTGTFIVALILLLKGYNVRGVMSVNMPSNWYSFHPIQCKASHEAIINLARHRVAGFINKIISGNKVWFTLNNLYEFTGGIILSWISIGYLLFGRFFLAKLFFANANCDGCGICVKNCSFSGIKMRGKRNPKPFWTYSCESCMRCSAICPRNAIEAGQSWAVILYFLTAIPASAHILSLVKIYIPGIVNLRHGWFKDILDLLYFYFALFISYFIFHFLIRISFVNWLFTHTTMTHLKFWGRYKEPGTRLNHIDAQMR